MAQIFTAFLLTSAIGTVLALILTFLKPITRRIFSGGWHYYMWLVALLVMILPIRLNLPEKPVTTPPISETTIITENQAENIDTPIINTQPEPITSEQPTQPEKVSIIQAIKNFFVNNFQLFSFIWLMIAILLFLIKIVSYLVFLIKIHMHSEITDCAEVKAYTNRKMKTRVSDTICSPIMIGIISPTLLLPKTNITPEQLHNVLAHEMTHLKRNDILYKWFVSIVKCIHWFNPAIYFIGKQVNIDCEISCDLAVVKEMDEQQEKGYVETILSLLTHNNSKAIPLTTGMTGNKQTLKRRFTMIKNRKRIGKITQILSTVLAVVILATTVFTSGVLATEILNEDNSENIFDIEVKHNGYLVQLTNKPFFENGVMYLPLRELFEKTGLVNNEDSYIKWDNGKIILCLTEGDNVPEYDDLGNVSGNKPIKIQYYYGIEIGKAEYILNPEGTLPEHRHHLSLRKDMTNAPILKDNITYIPYEYVEYMVNKVMINHEITIWDITNITKNIDNIDNAENMTYEDIRSLQISVDNGHFPWRLDPEQVIMAFLSGKGISVSNIRLPEITNDTLKYVDGNIEMELFKPIDKTENGIWVVKTYKGKTGTATGANLHFEIQINGEYYNPELFWSNSNTGTINASYSTSDISNKSILTDFSEEEIQSAKSVVEQYFKATNERNRSAVLSTLEEWAKAPNVILWQDEIITVNNINFNMNDPMRKTYVENGRGSVNNTSVDNVIVFRIDFDVEIPDNGKSVWEETEYKNYSIILVRDDKNSQWLIDDMGY